jgi:hypothetical protein
MSKKLVDKKKVIPLGLFFIVLIVLMTCTHFCTNIWFLLTENGYFVPQESSIFRFEPTKMNVGSGGWWLYGKDNEYYYALYQSGYLTLQKGNEPENFDEFDYHTWGENVEYHLIRELR